MLTKRFHWFWTTWTPKHKGEKPNISGCLRSASHWPCTVAGRPKAVFEMREWLDKILDQILNRPLVSPKLARVPQEGGRVRGWNRYVEGCWGFSYLKIKNVLVSRLLVVGFWLLVFWFYGFKIYQMSVSCFQEEIDPISNIFNILLDGSSGLLGARLFENYQHLDFRNFEIYNNH